MPIERMHFWGISAVPLFYVLAAISIVVFLAGVWLRVAVWRNARGSHRVGVTASAALNLARDGLLGRRIFRGDAWAGLMHLLLMWGFVGLFIGTVLSTIDHWFVHFLTGDTYRVFSLCMEVFGAMLVLGIVIAVIRRYLLRVRRLENTAQDLWVLILLAIAAITGFAVEGTRLAVEMPDWENISFGGGVFAHALTSPAQAEAFYPYIWWFHALICLGLVAYFPFSKLFHSLAAPVNIALTSSPAIAAPSAGTTEDGQEQPAVSGPQFTFADLVEMSACTRCGRCNEVCPSASADEPFSPRQFISQANAYARAAGSPLSRIPWLRTKLPRRGSATPEIAPEQIWYCTTCRACLEVCPAYIGALEPINRVRVSEIEDGSRVPPLLMDALETIYRFDNPWEPSKRKRSEWPAGLAVPDLTTGAEAGFCYFVGCTTSFDTRAQKLARAFVRILQHAGVSFGTLGQKETCCGDIARRAGEVGLFEEQVEKTAGLLERYGVTDLVTSSPHCFNLLKNEYPARSDGAPQPDAVSRPDAAACPDGAASLRVRHYTHVLEELVRGGLLRGGRPLDLTVTFHDPCYLGRYNGIYDEPRRIIKAIPGVRLVEMAHHGRDSLCCGGGGARMWQELEGEQKLSEVRIREAASTAAEVVVTACPYCLIMLEDAVKTAGFEGRLRVLDLNELVATSLGIGEEE